MNSGSERRSFLMSITLTELVLLMFFLLLLLAGLRISKLLTEKADVERKNRVLEELVSGGFAEADAERVIETLATCSQNDLTTVEATILEERVTALESELDSLSRESEAARRSLDSLRMARQALGTHEISDESFQRLYDSAVAIGAYDSLSRMREAYVQLQQDCERAAILADSVDRLNDIIDDQRAQIAHFTGPNEVGGEGFGPPPCWADASGSPEYIFEVALTQTAFSVRPAWPVHREERGDVDRVDGSRAMIGENLTSAEFRSRAAPVLAWSKAQTPECRHFVRINDSAEMSKTAFKANLLTVEDYFYKYLPGG